MRSTLATKPLPSTILVILRACSSCSSLPFLSFPILPLKPAPAMKNESQYSFLKNESEKRAASKSLTSTPCCSQGMICSPRRIWHRQRNRPQGEIKTYRSPIIPRTSIIRLPPIQPHTFQPPPPQLLLIDTRHALTFEMDQMRHIPRPNLLPHILATTERHTTALLSSSGDRSDKVRRREAARFAIEAPVQDQDLEAGTAGASNCFAHTLQNEGRDDGRVQTANAVDQGFCNVDGFKHLWVRRRPHFLAVRVDVPKAFNARGEGLLARLGEIDVRLTKRRQ